MKLWNPQDIMKTETSAKINMASKTFIHFLKLKWTVAELFPKPSE